MCVECRVSPTLGRNLHFQGHRDQLEGGVRDTPKKVSDEVIKSSGAHKEGTKRSHTRRKAQKKTTSERCGPVRIEKMMDAGGYLFFSWFCCC